MFVRIQIGNTLLLKLIFGVEGERKESRTTFSLRNLVNRVLFTKMRKTGIELQSQGFPPTITKRDSNCFSSLMDLKQ